MNKIALVGDIHLDPRCEKSIIKEHVIQGQLDFFDFMISDLKSKNITTILFSGDIFTSHLFVSVYSLDLIIKLFSEKMKDFDIHIIGGNHDYMYENKDSISALSILKFFPNVHLYIDNVSKINLLNHDWYMIPWIFPDKKENFALWLKKMGKTAEQKDKTVLFGHFDMLGMLMEAGQKSEVGIDPNKFLNISNNIFSGHYHCRSMVEKSGGKIVYLGTPYQLSFAHVNTECGYYILDDNMKLEFVENTISPKFIDIIDTDNIEHIASLNNNFVRFYMDNANSFDVNAKNELALEEKHPIYIKKLMYGGNNGTLDDCKQLDDTETQRILVASDLDMADIYMDKYPEKLPILHSNVDVKEIIKNQLKLY